MKMARHVIVLALILAAVAGLVSAKEAEPQTQQPGHSKPDAPARGPPPTNAPKSGAASAAAPEATTSTSEAAPSGAPTSSDVPKPDFAMPAPVGSEAKPDAPVGSGAATLRVSAAVAGVVAAGFFY